MTLLMTLNTAMIQLETFANFTIERTASLANYHVNASSEDKDAAEGERREGGRLLVRA